MDTWGPAQVAGIGGFQKFVMFIDDHSCWTRLYALKTREAKEVLDKFQEFESELKTQYDATIKTLHSDRGGEFLNAEFNEYLKSKGIRRRLTTHDTPEHNGIVE